jgi:CRP/FNR family transcriptional regulator
MPPYADRPVKALAGTILFRPDDPCSGFLVLRGGTIRVSLTAENGREVVLYRVQPGEVCLQTFACLVEGRSYAAEGVAESEVDALLIPADEFQQRVAEDAAFRAQLFAGVASRFSDLEHLVEDLALTGLQARLARLLLRRADAAGRIAATHEELAIEIASGRAVVTRQLHRLAKAGVVSLSRGAVTLLDRAACESLSHEG